ncbi:LPS assembly protein LptD [Psychrobium sp. 1_MG-2023]|uniref:LPS assembly protein LptD n=1 Tax=Psychrobium sp. 1_MG-2023 TaxID=3062624 RepID=UPI000C32FD91|nr:LPS assembly protein LptD [Psychrobium sp. 1_MG-2023]MDP2559589.1 LPS assembly protein LptD [Psychrobium sp. 1_MG-2023]PKF59423.1 LPS assembly protein LptD [Alteromonadales bacterium alter-6D02]
MRILTLLSVVLLSQNALAQSTFPTAQCQISTPYIPGQSLKKVNLSNQQQILVSADQAEINYPDRARYMGNVHFYSGDTFIQADNAEYSETDNLFSATGNLHYQDETITLTSNSLTTSLDGKHTELLDTKYWLNGMMVHGQSDSFKVDQGRYLILSNAQFTTCPDEQPDWALHAKEIKIDSTNAWAEVSRATLEVFDVPVFYFPYLTLPISDKRSSGFLYPTIGSSKNNGAEVGVPFYWNIAPEFDMTITPRVLTERGVQLNTEFRYLVDEQQGLFNLEYLPQDSSLDDEKRYLVYWQHAGEINENWRISSDFTHVSDDNYFNDIGSEYANKTDSQLIKNIELSYFQPDWWVNFKVQDIQVLGVNQSPYQLLPQLAFHSYQNPMGSLFEYDMFSEFSYFERSDNQQDNAARLHVEPTLRLPLNYSAFSLTSELKLMQTWYQQSDVHQEQSISRTLPQFRLHGMLNLEREASFFGRGTTQSLEPQIQYLRVPYQDQSDISLYDTALLRDDFHGLFRSHRFSGLDRIVDTDQVTLGVTTRFKDRDNKESLSMSIGQTFYLSTSEMAQQENNNDEDISDRSALAGEIDFKADDKWYFSQAIQLNKNQSEINQSKLSIDYRLSENKLVQLSHRYVKEISNSKINQLGLKAVWPVNEEWTFVGNLYRDINLHRTIESFVGLQYESCCWAIRFQAYRQLQAQYDQSSNFTLSGQEEFDSGISFNFQIRGLGSTSKQNAASMLSDGLFSYRQPYYLKN